MKEKVQESEIRKIIEKPDLTKPLAISCVSLRCINENDRVIAADHNGLLMENSTKPIEENAQWIIVYYDPLWILINHATSMCLIFDTKNKHISKPLKVNDGHRHLLLRISSKTTKDNQIAFELFDENNPQNNASIIFFVFEGFQRTFPIIDHDSISNLTASPKINTIANIVNNLYDYIVIGSSFCAAAFIKQTKKNNPKAKILVLERGLKYLPKHHQHCPSCSSPPRDVESRPWTICSETTQNEFIKNLHGQIPFQGGRSTYWSGWSPTPSTKELTGWPEKLKSQLQETYFHLARRFLGVITANEIHALDNENNLIYHTFQASLKQRFDSAANIESIDEVMHAPLAMGNNQLIKFSTVDTLESMENVTIIHDCTVEQILHNEQRATALQTNQGIILLPTDSKLILAMSTLPATTLVLNSFKTAEFPRLSNVGKRFTAHFVSSVIARVPRPHPPSTVNASEVELAAVYITGMKGDAQYHLQLSGVNYTQHTNDSYIHEICKKYSANSIPKECIDTSKDYVVVSCSTLGELDYKNRNNQFNLIDNSQSLTTNGELKLHLNEQDKELWNCMDNKTFEVMNKLSSDSNNNDLQYWHETDKTWRTDIPLSDEIRKPWIVHDASTMWIGDDEDIEAPVGLDYRLHGINNVYITGGALWPTGGSWNPVLTIVAMAIHLADTIYDESKRIVC
ncbi:hypothetical protein I4U23_005864 [Adineta vaga]|nr:hypothetical protein I4U23_005864 [Adineta vaga]